MKWRESELQPYERPHISVEEAASGEFPCVCDGKSADIWVVFDEVGEEEEDFIVLSEFPYPWGFSENGRVPEHPVDIEIQNIGISEILAPQRWNGKFIEDMIDEFMHENSLEPGVPFRVRLTFCFEPASSWYEDEPDMWTEVEVLDKGWKDS